jgi:hypothetical protein
MPHLAFHLDFAPPPEERQRFGAAVVRHFADAMDTGTDHVGVSIATYPRGDLVFGRAEQAERGIAFLDADIRAGRTREQRRRFSLAVMAELERSFGVPQRNVYVVFTEHDGEHFHMDDRVLPSWTPGEDPLAGQGGRS